MTALVEYVLAFASGTRFQIPQLLLEFQLQDLAIGVAGQCFCKDDVPGKLDLINSGTKEFNKFDVTGDRVGFQRNESDWTSPHFSSVVPITETSAMAGCSSNSFSISAG